MAYLFRWQNNVGGARPTEAFCNAKDDIIYRKDIEKLPIGWKEVLIIFEIM